MPKHQKPVRFHPYCRGEKLSFWVGETRGRAEQLSHDIPVLELCYTDLVNTEQKTLNKIFSYCDLPLLAVEKAFNAYQRDSQMGTPLGRENPQVGNQKSLNKIQKEWVAKLFKKHPFLEIDDRNCLAKTVNRVNNYAQQS
ncbi:MAG: hypothetical protein AAGG51_10820 [Cyanobacteria bacterium P01_G01_bin.54]